MVNKFGEARIGKRGPQGDIGPPGKRGPPGAGLCSAFFSKQLTQWFYENLSFSCYFPDQESGFIYKDKKAIGIKNRVKENHAQCKNQVGKLIKIPDDGFGLEFRNSLYEITNLDFANSKPSKAILIFAFKVDAWPSHYQYIFNTKDNQRSVYLKGVNLIIKGGKTKEVAVEYFQHQWNICYIEFNNIPGELSHYQINEEIGTFETSMEKQGLEVLYIGSKDSYYFQGVIARIDILLKNPVAEGDESKNLPLEVRKSVFREFYKDYL